MTSYTRWKGNLELRTISTDIDRAGRIVAPMVH